MIPAYMRREFPAPSIKVFVALQMLDILTTLMGLRMGAKEASVFIGQLMRLDPISGLLIAKIFAIFFVALALRYRRGRLIVFLNYWFAVVVSWNLVMVLVAAYNRRG